MSFNNHWWFTEFTTPNQWRWRVEICPRNASLATAITEDTPFVPDWAELPRDFLKEIEELETSYEDNFPIGFPAALRCVVSVDAAEFARVYDWSDAGTLTLANGALYLPRPSGAPEAMEVLAGHIWVFRTDKGNPALDLTEPDQIWWIGMQSQDTTVEIEQELRRMDDGTVEIGELPVKIELLDPVFEIFRQINIYAFGEYLLYKHRRTGSLPAKRVKRVYDAVQKRASESFIRTLTEDWGNHHAALISRSQLCLAMTDVMDNYFKESGISQHLAAGGVLDSSAVSFFRQRYDQKGHQATELQGYELYLIAAVYDGATSDTPIYGLFVKQTLEGTAGIQGAGFDGESLWDMLANVSPGCGHKSRVAYRDGYGFIENMPIFDPPLLASNKTLNVLQEALNNPVYSLKSYTFRSFGFNVEVDPADTNVGEFKALVRSAGVNTSDDVLRRMQLHNLPRIRRWDAKPNPDCPAIGGGGLSFGEFTAILPQIRQMPYTLRRWYYIDSVDGVSGELSGDIVIRVADYIEWCASDPSIANAGAYSGDEVVGTFDGNIEAWFKEIQKKGGLPGQLAAMLGYEFDETGAASGNPINLYALKVNVDIGTADAVNIGDVYEVSVPIRTYLDGIAVLVSCKTDILKGVSECEFLVRAPR